MADKKVNLLKEQGYIVYESILPDKIWFEAIYKNFSNFIKKGSELEKKELIEYSKKWSLESNNGSYYCEVPFVLRDRDGTQGKGYKIYLQWCLEFWNSKILSTTILKKNTYLVNISKKLEELEEICSRIFKEMITLISENYPKYESLYSDSRPLPIVFKIIRYKKRKESLGTVPHSDKSALSMIIDSDDSEVNWRIGKGEKLKLSEMFAPFNYPSDRNVKNHTILFPGLCLNEIDVDIDPTPHYVKTVDYKKYRHSIVAFLLVPNLKNTDQLQTNTDYIHGENI